MIILIGKVFAILLVFGGVIHEFRQVPGMSAVLGILMIAAVWWVVRHHPKKSQ